MRAWWLLLVVVSTGCGRSGHDAPDLPPRDLIQIPASPYRDAKVVCDEPAAAQAIAIDRRSVSCAQYRYCIRAHACTDQEHFGCEDGRAFIRYGEALDFCKWRGGRLPTASEWQKAARKDARVTPTADNSNACTLRGDPETGPCEQRSGYGLEYTLPSIGEWTATTCLDVGRKEQRPVIMSLVGWLDDPKFDDAGWANFRCVEPSPGAVP